MASRREAIVLMAFSFGDTSISLSQVVKNAVEALSENSNFVEHLGWKCLMALSPELPRATFLGKTPGGSPCGPLFRDEPCQQSICLQSLRLRLTKIKADAKADLESWIACHALRQVRSYFRRVLFKPPWEDPTWAVALDLRRAVWKVRRALGKRV